MPFDDKAPAAPQPTPAPQPPMHDLGQCIHFVAAQELLQHGMLAPDTVELLIVSAPQPISTINPSPTNAKKMAIAASFLGAGRAFTGQWTVDAENDAKNEGRVSQNTLDQGVYDLAARVKQVVKSLWVQQTAKMSKIIRSNRL